MLSPILMTFDAFYGQVNSRPTVIVSDLYTWIWNADLFQSGIRNFRIEQSFATSSKIRPDFSNKKSFRIEVTKKSLFTKSVRLNSYSSMKKKKIRKIENWLWNLVHELPCGESNLFRLLYLVGSRLNITSMQIVCIV